MTTLLQFAQSATTSTPNEAIFAMIFLGLGIFAVIATILVGAAYIINGILLGKILKEAGFKSWIAWVPVYNSRKTLEMSRLKFGKSEPFDTIANFLPIFAVIRLAKDKTTKPTV